MRSGLLANLMIIIFRLSEIVVGGCFNISSFVCFSIYNKGCAVFTLAVIENIAVYL